MSDYIGHRDLPDGRHLCVVPLTFGRARLLVSNDAMHSTYEHGY